MATDSSRQLDFRFSNLVDDLLDGVPLSSHLCLPHDPDDWEFYLSLWIGLGRAGQGDDRNVLRDDES